MSRLIVVLALDEKRAKDWCARVSINPNDKDVIIVRDIRSLEGLRFGFNDVFFADDWEKRSDIVEIMDLIKRYNVTNCSCRRTS